MFTIKTVFYKFIILVIKFVSKFSPQGKPLLFAGSNSSEQLVEHVGLLHSGTVFVVTDKILVQLGLVQPIVDGLKAAGLSASIYDGVQPDPSVSQVNAAVKQCIAAQCSAVVAVGGGSVLDTAKAVAAMAAQQCELEALIGLNKLKVLPLPTYMIPTTAGTGSEVTVAAVISDDQTHEKLKIIDAKLMPSAAAVDPQLMLGLPPGGTAATGMDALTHAVEAYVSTMRSDETNYHALVAVKLILENLPKAYADGSNLAARQAMAVASTYAGMAFSKANVGYVHAFAHQLGARYGIPHGLANAMVLVEVLKFYAAENVAQLTELAIAAGYANSDSFITAVQSMSDELNIPRSIERLVAEDIAGLAKDAADEAHYFYAVPAYMPPQTMRDLLTRLS